MVHHEPLEEVVHVRICLQVDPKYEIYLDFTMEILERMRKKHVENFKI
jgi:hypothetical protein